jgi:ribonuclease T
MKHTNKTAIKYRFRGFLPVVVDVETGGLNPYQDALLEIAAIILCLNENGELELTETLFCNVEPFAGANIDPKALEFNHIIPDHPFRDAKKELDALHIILDPIRNAVKTTNCKRAILVGHNAFFDLNFLNAAVQRTEYKHNPFHAFCTLDTVTLAAMAYGHTVLARACQRAGLNWNENEAHSSIYDVEKTAQLFCKIMNQWANAIKF